ncbi:MAG: cobyrinic acid a,c-diamide synthase [Sphingobacteriia bacterium 24-36-13]|jgi:cellulose biosynthesis protein BcsQ|uniref:ParA family protein n=1 Tax=Sediminibacterium sp. TaxID=1917865 RepID=UPI000BC8FE16|nr:AAA family ATPase [Sediminibacterium sp.]OYY10963.1 MAG: cobyrinic acid a,c-diamide synthase [Sphingobacteriia bacterium 35-36-14]OYZ53705.1 MAG: cobyrinic acid a,c-diamide synthase [Sphingobacteriia bacterium 24-36-13]OZA64814.1 MAG: cobyrinic acid a,c-diamide synthase [Sphingobacteriia bacterium 39-36-14]HQS24842.1 AAA family ATPase [Sediminibacterium sp.]HQS35437.1 AAA family ATPase [Sediminibacterium sp.]
MVTIALYNLKGGVGKTAATINLAYLSAKQGYKTLIWDLDPQGSSSFYLGAIASVKNEAKKILTGDMDLATAIQPSAYENLDIIPADLSARHADILLNDMKQSKKKISSILSTIKNEYDIVFLDCPPGISVLHDAVFAGVDWILMPNIPTTLSIRSFESVLNYFKENELDSSKLKCFFSMVDHRKNLHHEVINEFYKDKLFFKSYIPYLSDVEKMGVHESPLETFAASSFAAQCYKDLWKEIKQRCIN